MAKCEGQLTAAQLIRHLAKDLVVRQGKFLPFHELAEAKMRYQVGIAKIKTPNLRNTILVAGCKWVTTILQNQLKLKMMQHVHNKDFNYQYKFTSHKLCCEAYQEQSAA